ncbi:MAG: hypothetical protein RIB32_04190 [Phycisphaerales bacterium]
MSDQNPMTAPWSVSFPFTDRARRFGYVIWPKKRQAEVTELVRGAEQIQVVLNGANLGKKRVDYKYCRISVGRTSMTGLADEASTTKLSGDGQSLHVDIV